MTLQTDNDLIRSMERLTLAALARDATWGDPIRLIEVREELWLAAQAANLVLSTKSKDPGGQSMK